MENRVSVDVPGIGEVAARKGTSTAELAGAASYWADRYSAAWKRGFLSASFIIGISIITAKIAIYLIF